MYSMEPGQTNSVDCPNRTGLSTSTARRRNEGYQKLGDDGPGNEDDDDDDDDHDDHDDVGASDADFVFASALS